MGGWAIAVHGGAGLDTKLPLERQDLAKLLLTRCLNLGISVLRSNFSAIDVVELVVRELESNPLFNSGRGSALTDKRNGADGSQHHGWCREAMRRRFRPHHSEESHIPRSTCDGQVTPSYLAFSGAEEFAKKQGVKLLDNDYFITKDNVSMLKLFDS